MEQNNSISEQTRDLFLDPETDIDEVTRVKRPEGIGFFDIFSSDPAKRRAAFFGESKADKRDLFKLLKDDEQFKEEFDYVQNQKALTERQENQNSIQNQTFDFFHNKIGLSPTVSRNLTFAADFTPIYGEAVSYEDAVNAFKKGDIGEGVFHSTLVGLGLVPYAGDLLVHALKGNKNAIPNMFGKSPNKPEDLKPDSMFVYDTSGEAVTDTVIMPKGGGKGHIAPNPNLVESRKIFMDFIKNEPELAQKLDVDQNGDVAYTGNIIADIKTMPKPLAKKTVEKLDEMWVKTGWTAGANNRFFTEIDDRDAFFDAKKFIQLQKKGYEENKQLLSFLPKQKSDVVNVPDIHYPMKSIMLSDVLKHKKLYDAYPELRNLPIKMFTYNQVKKDFSTLGAYLPSTDAQIRLNPRIFQNEGLKKGEIGFFPKGDDVKWTDYDYKNAPPPDSSVLNRIKSVILHEVQHAIQHIEGFPHTNDKVAKEALDKQKNNLEVKLDGIKSSFNLTMDELDKLENLNDPSLANDISNLYSQANSLISRGNILKFEKDKLENLSNDDVYRNAWNEVESRNVQNRMWMDMGKREKMSPYKTISSTKKFNRRDIVQRLATNDETGVVDYDKYQKIMDEYELNMLEYIDKASKEINEIPVYPETKSVTSVAFEEDDIKAILYDFFYEKVTPIEAAHMIKDVDFGPVHQKFGRLYKGYMARERAKINKSLPLFSKENVKKFLVGEKSLIEQAEDDIIQLNNFLSTPEGARIGLADVTFYDTEEYLRKGLDEIGEVTPQSVDDTDPFPIFAREPEEFDIGKSKYNKILRNPKANRFPATETFLRIDNPKGDLAGEYYNYDYGQFYGDASKKRVQDLYERGQLKDFIDLYKETGGQNMPDEMIVDEFFDDVDFKVTAYPVDKDGNSVTVKFHPSELIEFPGAAAEHRTRNLEYERVIPTASSKRTIKKAEEMADKAVKSYDKKDIRKFIFEFLYDEFKDLAPEAGKKVEDFKSQLTTYQLFEVGDNYEKFSKLQDEHIDAIYDEAIQKVIRNPDGSLNDVEVEEMPKKALALLVQEVRNKNRGTANFKLKNLKDRIAKEGYDPDPIHVVVRQDGKPFIHEGNHRLQEAFDSDRDFIEARLTYIRGGEEANGPLNPERIGIKEKGYLK